MPIATAPLRQERYSPAATPGGFVLGWSLFRIAVWTVIAIWLYPPLLTLAGGDGIADWLLDHPWVRWLGAIPLVPLALVSALDPATSRRRSSAREDLAARTGAGVAQVRGLDPTYGIADGPGLGMPVGRWSMEVGRWTSKGRAHTVASVKIPVRSSLSFVARGADREPAMLRGLQQFAVGHAVRRMAANADNPRASAAATALAFMTEPPIPLGVASLDRDVVLRSNQPAVARALFTTSGVTSALAALNLMTRKWDWSFYPAAAPGQAEMRLECPGALRDESALRSVAELVRAALEELERAGILGE